MPPKAPQIPIKKDEDATYRYKMPRLTSSRLSSGNGVKTSIINSSEICKAISRTQLCLTQWFGYSLAVQSRINPTSGQIVLNGDHPPKKLLDSLYEFIDNFILCPNCSNPETTMDKKNNGLVLHCAACGHTEPAGGSKSAYVQRTTDWILSHLVTEQRQPQNVTQRGKGRIDEIDEFQRTAEADGSGSGVSINCEELEAISKELDRQTVTKVEKLSQKEESDYLDSLPSKIHGDDADDVVFYEFQKIAERGGWNTPTRVAIIIDSLLKDHELEILDVIIQRRGFLIRFLDEEGIQKDFLNALAKFVEVTKPELMTSACVIWHKLFDNEIVEEPALRGWEARPSKRFETTAKAAELRAILKPFYSWLDTAEVEKDEFDDPNPDSQDEAVEEDGDKVDQDFVDDI